MDDIMTFGTHIFEAALKDIIVYTIEGDGWYYHSTVKSFTSKEEADKFLIDNCANPNGDIKYSVVEHKLGEEVVKYRKTLIENAILGINY